MIKSKLKNTEEDYRNPPSLEHCLGNPSLSRGIFACSGLTILTFYVCRKFISCIDFDVCVIRIWRFNIKQFCMRVQFTSCFRCLRLFVARFYSADFSVSFDRTSYPERYYLSCLPDKKRPPFQLLLTCRLHRCHIQVHVQWVHVSQGHEAS